MILLLDAHTILWWLADDPNLGESARAAIKDPANDVLVSAASVWEIEIKRALGRLIAPDGISAASELAGSLESRSRSSMLSARVACRHTTAIRSIGCWLRRRPDSTPSS